MEAFLPRCLLSSRIHREYSLEFISADDFHKVIHRVYAESSEAAFSCCRSGSEPSLVKQVAQLRTELDDKFAAYGIFRGIHNGGALPLRRPESLRGVTGAGDYCRNDGGGCIFDRVSHHSWS